MCRTAEQLEAANTDEEYVAALNEVEWDEEERQKLQSTVDESTQQYYCGNPQGVSQLLSLLPLYIQ